jgi:hypothetical protein
MITVGIKELEAPRRVQLDLYSTITVGIKELEAPRRVPLNTSLTVLSNYSLYRTNIVRLNLCMREH